MIIDERERHSSDIQYWPAGLLVDLVIEKDGDAEEYGPPPAQAFKVSRPDLQRPPQPESSIQHIPQHNTGI